MHAFPTNTLVDPMLTDLYQLTMAYGYWKNGVHQKNAVFDLFFRRCPFGGEFAIFAGLEQVLRFLETFKVTDAHLAYLKTLPEFASKEPAFFDWLRSLDASNVRIYAHPEGSLAFPRVPLLRIEGPLAVCQIMETTLLTLVNFACLITTNAARYRLAAGADKVLMEFGLRRAQGPDGGVSASYYSYLGGFDSTSNVKAGEVFGLPVAGTHAHAFVESFTGFGDIIDPLLADSTGKKADFVATVASWRDKLGYTNTNNGELAAFCAYALAFPDRFTALVDTYNTLESGIPNFLVVASALFAYGYKPGGIRLDSGDLAYLSLKAKAAFLQAAKTTGFAFEHCKVTASNDIDEAILWSLRGQAHGIDNYGIGTNLVTCSTQPSFGGVYKLVEIDGHARVKLSEQLVKVTIPGCKKAFRLYGREGLAIVDLLLGTDEPDPQPNVGILCRDPFDATKKANVVPSRIVPLLLPVWEGKRLATPPSPGAIQSYVIDQLDSQMRQDHLRPDNPTRYKVSVGDKLYTKMHALIEQESIVRTID